jgi:hypothetical protein
MGATATNNGSSSPMGTSITTTQAGSYVYTATAGVPTNPSSYPTFVLEAGENSFAAINDNTGDGFDQVTLYQQRTTAATVTPGALQTGWTYSVHTMAEWVACSLEIIPNVSSVYTATTFVPIATYSYYGADSVTNPANGLRDTNGILYQGEDVGLTDNGNQYSFSYIGSLASALAGTTVDGIQLVSIVDAVNNALAYEVIGYSTESSFTSTGTLVGATQATNVAAVVTGTNYVDVTSTFTAGWQAGTDVSILFGPGPNTNIEYWLELQGGAGAGAGPRLTVNYHTNGAAPAGGTGAAGSISITYVTPGSGVLQSSISPIAGTDSAGNAFPPGIAGIDQGVSYVRLNSLEQVGFGPLPYTADDITIGRQSAGILSVVDTSALFYGSIWQDSRTPSVDTAPANAYDWTLITPNTNWTNRGGATPKLACRKIPSPPNGVQIQGEVIWTSTGVGLTSGTVIGTMGAAFFPNTERLLTCVVSSVTGTFTRTSPLDVPINVTTTGQLKIFNLTGGAVAGNNVLIQLWGTFSLDGP